VSTGAHPAGNEERHRQFDTPNHNYGPEVVVEETFS
jgi:hypothetical protein